MTDREPIGAAAVPVGALDGLVVADFSRVLAGPLATMFLADLGATVIKVERPGVGDDTRAWGPPFAGDASSYYLAVNRNKCSVAIDLAGDEGVADALALASRADVVVENFRPGRLAEVGLDFPSVEAVNPGVIYCSISGFGAGAGASLPGYDFVVQAVGGLMSLTGPEEGPPSKVGVAMVDVLTGLHAVIGILAAVEARHRTGRGQLVEVNLLSSLLASLVNQGSAFLTTGTIPLAMGNRHPSIAPYETFDTADRPLAIAVGNDRQFRSLCAVLGIVGLADDPRFFHNPNRVANRRELVTHLERALALHSAAHWARELNQVGVPCGPINDLSAAFDLAEHLGLEAVTTVGTDDRKQLSNPIRMSETPPGYQRPPPKLGADDQAVLRWLREGGPLPGGR